MEGYRKNVAMVVMNNNRQVLICRRKGTENCNFLREESTITNFLKKQCIENFYEEVGLKRFDVSIIGKTKHAIKYDIPPSIRSKVLGGKFKGQLQTWFLLKIKDDNYSINLNCDDFPEFDMFDWVSYWYPMSKIVEFKKEAYREALKELRNFI